MLDTIMTIAKEAGDIVLSYRGNVETRQKGESYSAENLVTDADLMSEKHIVKALHKNFPHHGVYAEEEHRDNLDSPYVWYIDPLDGTSNFVRNIPLFGISIGLMYHGKSILGVLYFPALDLMLQAQEGKGAYANNKKITVSKRDLRTSLYHAAAEDDEQSHIKDIVHNHCGLTKTLGATSYEFAQIAMGDAEVYIRRNVPHDIVAGIVILTEAGGLITDHGGEPWSIESVAVVASNGIVHNEVLSLIGKSSEKC